MLSPTEQERYQHHFLLKQIGGAGQAKLKQAKVLMVGAGALGSSCLFYLAAAGVGTIAIVDDDKVEISNLQRQILYTTNHLNQSKAHIAKAQLSDLNPEIKINAHQTRFTKKNGATLIKDYDFIADGTDNFTTRLLINDLCYFTQKPLTTAAIGEWTGQLASFHSGKKNAAPSWRCFVGKSATDAPSCEQGVLGALCGVMGSLQALEIIKQITGAGDTLLNKILLLDGLTYQSRIIGLKWDKKNPLNGESPTITPKDCGLSE